MPPFRTGTPGSPVRHYPLDVDFFAVDFFAVDFFAGEVAVDFLARDRPVAFFFDDVEPALRAASEAAPATLEEARQALLSSRPAPDERVILDPPRTGAGADVVQAIAARRPSVVVYVACDPPTLGRDLKTFAAAGYVPDAVRAFDLFPDTFHLETVVRLLSR